MAVLNSEEIVRNPHTKSFLKYNQKHLSNMEREFVLWNGTIGK